MVFPNSGDFGDDDRAGGSNRRDRASDEIHGSEEAPRESTASRDAGLSERLREILEGGGDGDLLIRPDEIENSVLQWLQALDLQVVGACRAEERLKPMLNIKPSMGLAEDRLLLQLSQHFDASEVALLARCLCVPLVSMRVGKIVKQGTRLCPTTERGHLNLTLLPYSDMRITFSGDDGCIERFFLVSNDIGSSAPVIEKISADTSGRSYLIKLPCGQVSYFWCSEKSKLRGSELYARMKEILRMRPSLSQLTGISESRLESFAVHLRAYLNGSSSTSVPTKSAVTPALLSTLLSHQINSSSFSSPTSSKTIRVRPQGSLSPRANSFKDGPWRNPFSSKSGPRERPRRRIDSHCPQLNNSSPSSSPNHSNTASQTEAPLNSPESVPSGPSIAQAPTVRSPLFSPHYCWCPPPPVPLQCMSSLPSFHSLSSEALSLPPLSSLLPTTRSGGLLVPPPNPTLDLPEISSLSFPSRFPLPVSSFITIPSTQQIPTFTQIMSDPIVHIPVIHVCSSGQGYLVSAGPTISTTISPLLPNSPLIPEPESVAEKNARETLRMLMGTAPGPQLMEVLPAVLTGTDDSLSFFQRVTQNPMVAGSRGLYSGTQDVDAVANCISSMALASSVAAAHRTDAVKSSGRCWRHSLGDSEEGPDHAGEDTEHDDVALG
ncbi:hypothetical protein QJS04_geneDACA007585 [Acorus gramineus]|uniref:Uncharacterized protein n=1 Tax=Acorus gramineus TaxID=55184 RepID=A0AAV9B1D8_ACOGR|nr:hypothetical protein QJS04_geneDACA007585 [Acorus gramineus]